MHKTNNVTTKMHLHSSQDTTASKAKDSGGSAGAHSAATHCGDSAETVTSTSPGTAVHSLETQTEEVEANALHRSEATAGSMQLEELSRQIQRCPQN